MKKEAQQVPLNNKAQTKVSEMWKKYEDGTLAIKEISFAVEKGEIFGLLGIYFFTLSERLSFPSSSNK